MNEPIISISGIRGIFGKSLKPVHVIKYCSGFASYIRGKKRVVIGRDGRLGGDIIQNLAESVLLFSGCEVINLGVVSTPTISLAVETLGADGGIIITASHNPQQWNGLKFMNREGIFLNKTGFQDFLKQSEKVPAYSEVNDIKQVEYYPDFYKVHIARALSISNANYRKIKSRKFRVVVDCVNASGSVIIPELLGKLGCEVYKINCDGSGIFPRKPEPLPENLKQVCREVRLKKADMGIVVDPDADRLVIITEKGKPFGEENTITTAVKYVLSKSLQNKTAVVNLSTSRSVDDVVNQAGGRLFKSPVGEINVIEKMKKVRAVIGGEGSGGVILPELHYCRDSLAGIVLLLSAFSEFNGTVSEYRSTLPQYHIEKTVVNTAKLSPDIVFSKILSHYSAYKINTEDGIRIDFEHGWVNLRKSNTEPIIRIISEAQTRKLALQIQRDVLSLIS
jgi:phosphomannomutase